MDDMEKMTAHAVLLQLQHDVEQALAACEQGEAAQVEARALSIVGMGQVLRENMQTVGRLRVVEHASATH